MKGDPVDPVTFSRAVKELFEKMAAHEGIDLVRFYRSDDEAASPEMQREREQIDQRLGELRGEADFRVQGLMIVEELRTWVDRNGEWRRVTQDELKAWLMTKTDVRAPFYLDRHELQYLRPDRYALEKHAGQIMPEASEGDKRKRGRPQNSGSFAKSDAPFLLEMRALLESGEALSVTAAAQSVASRARGPATLESRATRLRRAYLARWPHGE